MSVDRAVIRSLELAWMAFGSGTVPVGAVVSSPDGAIVLEGRNRMYEDVAPPGELAGSLLAHAEVSALARLDPEQRHQALTITSTLEPCPLCLGAIHMSTVGRLVYLGADPYGGAVGHLQHTPHTARAPVSVRGPRTDALGLLASALHVAFYLERNPSGHVVRVHRQRAPDVLAAATVLADQRWIERAASATSFPDVLPELLKAVAGGAGTPS